ncbi:twin-arginine translocase TatA/TatE family subunit [Mucilaginibacter sp. JRF]|uniref:Sec-independent protein translocase subunit TatA/TatB n=1 Tax=Mucilaginibacter sp. JRF TaxID=2780088 RepID=UPI00188286C9|nr:twin-arginine translocase TatA/TatE family subunit [Mucilaginibacter sp. JRF]MBE9585326.1 twin-arginine translocase TatA/TatE family subunit [Mucilaginibacter sp. JRF]
MHNSVFLFLNIGTGELMLIFFVALLLFGGEKLPGLARSLGRGIRDFKDASEDVKREINKQINSFDEDKPSKTKQIASTEEPADESKAAEENNTAAEITDTNNNHEPENNVDTETEVAANNTEDNSADEQPEVKTPDFTRPANTFEYKG